MKRAIIVIFLFALPFLAEAQLSGLGTYASPWSGTLNGDATWSGTKYINGDIIVDNEKLTISAGAKIVFLSETADLIITGTGQLDADGASGNTILFTSDDDNDGNNGETGERWGHISFQSMGSAGASLIDNCIIEWGDVSGTSLPNRYGGGIHTQFTNLTISNSIIRNNRAGFGGGIFINTGVSPTLNNCYIQNNTSSSSGGGMYIWSNTASVISNCVISNNTSSSGGGGGGIFLGNLCGNVRFYNCTIVNNSASTNGKNIHFYVNTNPAKPSFINCIIWSPANSIYYTTQTPSTSDFVYCAIQNPVSGSTTNCITLNSSNSDPAGPNFVNISTPDYAIQFISPCRDKGTDTGAPATDIIGISRFGTTDIGAYENQHSRWTGTTSTAWETSTNWYLNMLPTSISNVVVPNVTNDPVISSNDVTLADLVTETGGLLTVGEDRLLSASKITNGGSVIFNPASKGTITTIVNNGTFKLESDANGISSLITTAFSGNNADVQLFLTGGPINGGYRWHYISSPFTSLSTDGITGTTSNLARWVESLASSNLLIGWVAYDGFVYNQDPPAGPYTGTPFNNLEPGRGYDHYFSSDHTYTLQGQLNTGNVTYSLGCTNPSLPNQYGLNLLGNPFSSGLDWDAITDGDYYAFPANTSKVLHYTKDGDETVYYINGVGSEPGVNGIIPPMQGFFTKTYASGNSITLAQQARTHNSIPSRYKGESLIPMFRIKLSSDGKTDYTTLRFDDFAKTGLDYDFDAVKSFISTKRSSLYTISEATKFSINGQPFPASNETLEIPLAVNILKTGQQLFSATEIQGLDNFNISLKDNVTGNIIDLKQISDLSFFSNSGLLTDRFVILINSITTDVQSPVSSKDVFKIVYSFENLNIQTISDDWDGMSGSMKIYEMSGKLISQRQNLEFWKNSFLQIPAPFSPGLYVVEINSGVKRYVGKVVIN